MSTLQQSLDAGGRQLPTYSQQTDWERSDEYHNFFLIKTDEDLSGALTRSAAGGLPDIGMLLASQSKHTSSDHSSGERSSRKILAPPVQEYWCQTSS